MKAEGETACDWVPEMLPKGSPALILYTVKEGQLIFMIIPNTS